MEIEKVPQPLQRRRARRHPKPILLGRARRHNPKLHQILRNDVKTSALDCKRLQCSVDSLVLWTANLYRAQKRAGVDELSRLYAASG